MAVVFFLQFLLILIITSHAAGGRNPWEGMDIHCRLEVASVFVEDRGCKSKNKVQLEYCRGNCRSASIYHHEYPYYKSVCTCCKAVVETAKAVSVECPNGNPLNPNKPFTRVIYKDVPKACRCRRCVTKKKK